MTRGAIRERRCFITCARIHASLLRLGHPGGLSVDVVDPDVVSEANIGRQPFSPYDVGRPKVEVL